MKEMSNPPSLNKSAGIICPVTKIMGACGSQNCSKRKRRKMILRYPILRHAHLSPAEIRWNDAPEGRQDRINDGWQHSLNFLDNLLGFDDALRMHDASVAKMAQQSHWVFLRELWLHLRIISEVNDPKGIQPTWKHAAHCCLTKGVPC